MEFSLVVIIVLSLFIFTHLRPLDEGEMGRLSSKKRDKAISRYFNFHHREYSVNKKFKKQMNPNGSFYEIDKKLYDFPSIAAGLLKYKKHEWIIVAFEKDKTIVTCWLNKGFDRSSVSSYLSVNNMTNVAKRNFYSSVLIFHNHPNSNPTHFDCSKPSHQDIKSANEFASTLIGNDINLLEFVCERGRHYEYYSKYTDDFMHVSEFFELVRNQNGKTKFKNLALHLSRFF